MTVSSVGGVHRATETANDNRVADRQAVQRADDARRQQQVQQQREDDDRQAAQRVADAAYAPPGTGQSLDRYV